MKKMRRLMASVLSALLLVTSCCLSPVFAAEYERNTEISERASWDISASDYITAANGNTVRISMTLTVRDEMANETGGYITNVKNVSAYNAGGWTYVNAKVNYTTPDYSHNHQQVSFTVTYYASDGEGTHTYTGQVTIHLADL